MRKIITFTGALLFLITVNLVSAEEQELSNLIKRLTYKKIVPLSKESIIVRTVKEANKEATRTLEEIKQLDNKWRETQGIDGWIGGFLNNPCANYLKEVQKTAIKTEKSLYAELFLMDKQGNIVAETNKTTDYWQGDENKFIKSFADGNGAIFIDEPFFDESTKGYLIQVSVPIRDPDTQKAIGALTVGIDIDILAEHFIY